MRSFVARRDCSVEACPRPKAITAASTQLTQIIGNSSEPKAGNSSQGLMRKDIKQAAPQATCSSQVVQFASCLSSVYGLTRKLFVKVGGVGAPAKDRVSIAQKVGSSDGSVPPLVQRRRLFVNFSLSSRRSATGVGRRTSRR
jgi:hypothetical protein